jgi:5'-phosphate synthase pdxT subunit
VKVGVTAVQGDVSEHLVMVTKAMAEASITGRAIAVRRPDVLEEVDALIIPGGESTTISRLLVKFGLFDNITRRAEEGMPIMGTCAGCILLAKEGDEQVRMTGTRLLGLMDMAIDRNAFGRQRESFEVELEIQDLGTTKGVFIRAPAIRRVWAGCRALARFQNLVVMARQDQLLALAFHPELSGSTKIHRMFLEFI